MLDTTQVIDVKLPGDRRGLAFASLIALSESIKPPESVKGLIDGGTWQWVHLAPYGVWRGHPNGEIRFSRAAFQNMIDVFAKRKNPVKVDYEHDSLSSTLPGYEKIAAGYIHQLEIRGDGWGEGDGLYGLVEFTVRAADRIRSGEVKYNSPVIAPGATDRKTDSPVGMELVQAAITSDPFLDGQVPITLTRMHEMADTANTPEQLALDAAPDGQTIALAEEMAADATSLLGKIGEMTGLDPAAVIAALMDKIDAVAKLLGAEAEQDGTPAAEEEPAAATRDVADVAAPATEPSEAQKNWEKAQGGAIAAMSRQIDELLADKVKRADDGIARQVDGLIASGNVLPGDRDLAIWAFKSDPKKAALIYRHKRVPAGTSQLTRVDPTTKTQTVTDLTDTDEMVIRNLTASGQFDRKGAEDVILKKRSN